MCKFLESFTEVAGTSTPMISTSSEVAEDLTRQTVADLGLHNPIVFVNINKYDLKLFNY